MARKGIAGRGYEHSDKSQICLVLTAKAGNYPMKKKMSKYNLILGNTIKP